MSCHSSGSVCGDRKIRRERVGERELKTWRGRGRAREGEWGRTSRVREIGTDVQISFYLVSLKCSGWCRVDTCCWHILVPCLDVPSYTLTAPSEYESHSLSHSLSRPCLLRGVEQTRGDLRGGGNVCLSFCRHNLFFLFPVINHPIITVMLVAICSPHH